MDPAVLAEEWARKTWPGPTSLARSAAVEAFIAGWEAHDGAVMLCAGCIGFEHCDGHDLGCDCTCTANGTKRKASDD